MSLRTYVDIEQGFRQKEAGSKLFGIQNSPKNKLLPLYNTYWPSNDAVTSITAVKIDTLGNEISRTTLSTSLIVYDTDQYLTDLTLSFTPFLDLCIYYIEFTNSTQTFQTEPFKVIDYTVYAVEPANYTFEDDSNYVFENDDNYIFEI